MRDLFGSRVDRQNPSGGAITENDLSPIEHVVRLRSSLLFSYSYFRLETAPNIFLDPSSPGGRRSYPTSNLSTGLL